jgi:hypothetical protein
MWLSENLFIFIEIKFDNFFRIYLRFFPLEADGIFGLQASGLPSGAQQVPVREPLLVVKLQSWPLLRDLQACMACAGGLPDPEPP